ncbi:LytTR family transcriptional regulator [Eggerthellaceae bacterium zg-1084]|uniref:LytTR family transcriptional regulator n=1 Tax=Berryella wangjianweii TaxID=2734634 RepID=A0A6M8J4T3_9ACTN|nr:LytTR family DNA-binding domain-containing protein [Berryella wangjianweii]NPD31161.1 LytTR family transcriptional regulator [Berryella wangjianweii]NPD32530.1 LytTR family transcriptional regulator [Eggerthellaceae bacterium zg-997]QKF06718.1 LytTR family transcriptional regulator [Berryella wangjianweii]
MRLTVHIDETVEEAVVTVRAPRMSEEVLRIQEALTTVSTGQRACVLGTRDDEARLIRFPDVLLFHTADKTVLARTREGDWKVRMRLRELVEVLDPAKFLQVNQGQIVNIDFVRRLDLSLAGTIKVELADGTDCFVSRRSLSGFKRALGF